MAKLNFRRCRACGATVPDGLFCDQCSAPLSDRAPHSRTGKSSALRLRRIGGREILVVRPGSLLGREEGDCAPMLAALDCVSARHAAIACADGRWTIEDLGSSNGTYVNDDRLLPGHPHEFRPGDVIDLGTYLFQVE